MNLEMTLLRCLLVLALAASSTLAAAQEEEVAPVADPGVWEQVLALYEKAKETGEQVPQDAYEWVKEDLGRLGDWEYLVTEIAIGDAAATQGKLNELGADRWECVWIHTVAGKTTFIFKRPTRSYLKHVPLSQLMKLVPSAGSDGE
jgi:hypothetical protein